MQPAPFVPKTWLYLGLVGVVVSLSMMAWILQRQSIHMGTSRAAAEQVDRVAERIAELKAEVKALEERIDFHAGRLRGVEHEVGGPLQRRIEDEVDDQLESAP